MESRLQVGEPVAFGELAWKVYQLGFADEHNATTLYSGFGRDVRSLAENLDTLTEIVGRTGAYLNQSQLPMQYLVVRWDQLSLLEIIGDYNLTLQECHDLVQRNQRYNQKNATRNMEWNVIVQPNAERLRQRILVHSCKICCFIKPFEFDLLCRAREDLQIMHADLYGRSDRIHFDLPRLSGIVIPDLETELHNRHHQKLYLLDVPDEISNRFHATLGDGPSYDSEAALELGDLSDAFIFNFSCSTYIFQSDQKVTDKIPPLEQYLNLLKCIWLYQRMARAEAAVVSPHAHWPSYVRQLGDELSVECRRVERELVRPDITPTIRRELFSVWPERQLTPLLDVVTRDIMMEEVLECPLESPSADIERSMRLLRHTGSDGRRYRLVLSGTETLPSRTPRAQVKVFDFDLSSVIVNPHYAMSDNKGLDKEITLLHDEWIARLPFTSIKDVLKFQQAVTGFEVWDSFCEYDVSVAFVMAGPQKPIIESTCVQLWVPKNVEGSFTTNVYGSSSSNSDARPGHIGTLSTIPSQPNSPNRSNASLATKDSMLNMPRKTMRASSNMSASETDTDSDATYESYKYTESTGSNSIGLIHRTPPKSKLVLFTQSSESRQLSFVTIVIDDKIQVNPERCLCHRSDHNGPSCKIVALERNRGKPIEARWFETSTHDDTGWNLARLALDGSKAPNDDKAWPSLVRASIMFPTVEARVRFSGIHCYCKIRTEEELRGCLTQGHQGLLGEVRQHHRLNMDKDHKRRYNEPRFSRDKNRDTERDSNLLDKSGSRIMSRLTPFRSSFSPPRSSSSSVRTSLSSYPQSLFSNQNSLSSYTDSLRSTRDSSVSLSTSLHPSSNSSTKKTAWGDFSALSVLDPHPHPQPNSKNQLSFPSSRKIADEGSSSPPHFRERGARLESGEKTHSQDSPASREIVGEGNDQPPVLARVEEKPEEARYVSLHPSLQLARQHALPPGQGVLLEGTNTDQLGMGEVRSLPKEQTYAAAEDGAPPKVQMSHPTLPPNLELSKGTNNSNVNDTSEPPKKSNSSGMKIDKDLTSDVTPPLPIDSDNGPKVHPASPGDNVGIMRSPAPDLDAESPPGHPNRSPLNTPRARLWFRLMNMICPPKAGCERLTYMCSCGELLYLDVKELTPGGIERFRQRLAAAAGTMNQVQPSTALPQLPERASLAPDSNTTRDSTGFTDRGVQPHQSSQSSGSETTQDVSTSTASSVSIASDPQYLLLCINTRRSTALAHIEVGSLTSDQYLFREISSTYQKVKEQNGARFPVLLPGWLLGVVQGIGRRLPDVRLCPDSINIMAILSRAMQTAGIHRISSADFVKFHLVPVGEESCPRWFRKPEFPPESEVVAKRYLYEPVPMEDVAVFDIPLAHLLKPRPHLNTFWLSMFPKKLSDELRRSGETKQVVGWGIRVNERLNWALILMGILAISTTISVIVVVYSTIRSDDSSAFGLGAFLAAMLTVYLTYQYFAWKDEI